MAFPESQNNYLHRLLCVNNITQIEIDKEYL